MRHVRIVSLNPVGSELPLRSAIQHVGQGGFASEARRRNDFDLHYFTLGEAMFSANGRETVATSGDAVIQFAGDVCSTRFPVPIAVYACHFHFPAERVDAVDLEDQDARRRLSALRHRRDALLLPDQLSIRDQGSMVEFLDSMIAAWSVDQPGATANATAWFLLVLDLLTKQTLAELEHGERVIGGSSLASNRVALNHVAKAIKAIDGRLHQRLSLASVARSVRLNPDYLSRIFRSHTGCSVGQYILRRRIERAKNLLIGAPISIKEIAGQLGLSDQLYFARAFKKATGMSPSEYRAKQQVDHWRAR